MLGSGEGNGRTRPILRLVRDGPDEQRSDAALAAAFLSGDDGAFTELVRRHERTVLAIARRYARDPDDARDLAQRAFLRAFEAARRTPFLRRDRAVPFRAWLLRIAVNLGKNHVRGARRWLHATLAEAACYLEVAPEGSRGLEREERAHAMRVAVLDLPRRQREVLTLRIDAELTFAEIGEALGITENNAKVQFHHAAKRLRALVTPERNP